MHAPHKPMSALACVVVLALALAACQVGPGTATSPAPSSHLSTATPVPTPLQAETLPEIDLPNSRSYPTPPPTPRPPVELPDLTPPPAGWIALVTSDGGLALSSPAASRRVLLDEGRVEHFVWSPDGLWLAFVNYRGQLAVASIEQSRLMPPNEEGVETFRWSPDGRWLACVGRSGRLMIVSVQEAGLGVLAGDMPTLSFSPYPAWSQDSRYLAYLLPTGPEPEDRRWRSPVALRLFDLTSSETITLTTYEKLEYYATLDLCSLPSSLLAVSRGGPLDIWNIESKRQEVRLDGAYGCTRLGLPDSAGSVFPQREPEKKPVSMPVERPPQPTSLAVWIAGAQAPVVVREAREREVYWPLRWLPDGRLEVRVDRWEQDEYQSTTEAEHREYRYFSVTPEGELCEVEASGLPWWAAGQFEARLQQSGLAPWETRLHGWQVGPDGETVAYIWQSSPGDRASQAIYLWRGEGEPLLLGEGSGLAWQPVPPSDTRPGISRDGR